jgi:glycerol kinase
MPKVLAIDQGTTATKAYTLDTDGRFAFSCSAEHLQLYPHPGWVEHDPRGLLENVLQSMEEIGDVNAVGIDHQGETIIAWDARSGEPVYNAIVWQDQRTSESIEKLKAEGAEEITVARAGLPLDPYFSASKLRWILKNVPAAARLVKSGHLMMGTSDSFFLYHLTGRFATDVTAASRTSLMNIKTCSWDPVLCDLFKIPMECLPPIRPTTAFFGNLKMTGRDIPVHSCVVDQQAALMGHGCFRQGEIKATFGTGVFAQANAGTEFKSDVSGGILPTIAWQLDGQKPVYAVDAGVYNAGSAVNWVKRLRLFDDFSEIDHFEKEPAITRGIVFVPALSGLACPFWDRTAAGLWIGMSLDTDRMDLCQAVLEGIVFRTAQLLDAVDLLTGKKLRLSVDGGLTANSYFCQFLADVTQCEIAVQSSPDITTYGTGRFALLGSGLVKNISDLPPPEPPKKIVHPKQDLSLLKARFDEAVTRSRHWHRSHQG